MCWTITSFALGVILIAFGIACTVGTVGFCAPVGAGAATGGSSLAAAGGGALAVSSAGTAAAGVVAVGAVGATAVAAQSGGMYFSEASGGGTSDSPHGQSPKWREDTGHIFQDRKGHLLEDTNSNRAIIESAIERGEVTNRRVMPDGQVIETWKYLRTNGTTAWAKVRNGTEIRNGGLNPRGF